MKSSRYFSPPRYAAPAALAPAALVVAALALTAGCGSEDSPSNNESSESTPAADRTLTVFAAASLQKPFEEIAEDFEKANDGVEVKFSFGGSSGLVAQLTDGAEADVLATANEKTMDDAVGAQLVEGEPEPYVSNTLQIVVPKDNPAGIKALADLSKPDAKVVLCAPQVPCGAAAASVEKSAGIDIKPVSEEQAVTDVLGKVRSGEADAGLVYITDVAGAEGEVTGIDFPEAKSAINIYPIAALKKSPQAELAADFIDAVTGAEGMAVLADAGFAPAP